MRVTTIAPATQPRDMILDTIATDKSISHRSAMFALLCDGVCEVEGFLLGEDTLHTLQIAQNLGLGVERVGGEPSHLRLIPPKGGIQEPKVVLECGNAGTGMRLYAGLLSGVRGHFVLSGDEYLNIRPMGRVIQPLSAIGARICGRENNAYAPLSIQGGELSAFTYASPIASAQVKSAMILAGLSAEGTSHFYEPLLSRDHTEKMLRGMGVAIECQELDSENSESNRKESVKSTASATMSEAGMGYKVSFEGLGWGSAKSQSGAKHAKGAKKLQAFHLQIPADPSSAFFFAVAACVLEVNILLKNVLLNKTRIEAFKVLESMGAKITYHQTSSLYEEVGDIEVRGAPLRGIVLDTQIPWLIDEIPALAIAFAIAQGRSEVRGAKELRVKECDRIHAVVSNLKAMGIECGEYEDGFWLQGGELKRARLKSYGDHRIAMSFAIAALGCGGVIEDSGCIDVSFPQFLKILGDITQVENVNESKNGK